MPIQLKTTDRPVKGQPNSWEFKEVLGYAGMPVVCWRADKQDGWVFDGKGLDGNGVIHIKITPNRKYAKMALSGVKPLDIDALAAFLEEIAPKYTPHTWAFLSWDFAGKAHRHLKERIGIYLYMRDVDSATAWPEAQAGSFDLVGSTALTTPTAPITTIEKPRLQFKTAHVLKGRTGLGVPLKESAGYVNGKPTHRPYDADAFDALVVYRLDWKKKVARRWFIPTSELKDRGYLRTATCNGNKTLVVYTSAARQHNVRRIPDTWTAKYYAGEDLLTALPPEAEAAAGHLLDDFRSGCAK